MEIALKIFSMFCLTLIIIILGAYLLKVRLESIRKEREIRVREIELEIEVIRREVHS